MKNLTYNVNFACSSKCQDYLLGQLLLVKQCYNYVSKRVFDEKLSHNFVAVHNATYHDARTKFPGLNSVFVQQTIKLVVSNYKSRKKVSKALELKNLSVQLTKSCYSNLTKKSIDLSYKKGKRETCLFRTYDKIDGFFAKYDTADPKLGYRNGHLYLSIPFKIKEIPIKDNSCLGVDLGCKRIATTSDGVAYADKEYLRARRKTRYLKRVLNSKKLHSKTARKHLEKLSKKECHQSKDFCHRLANKILETDKSTIVLEDLRQIKQKTSKKKIIKNDGSTIEVKRKSHNNRLSQVPFYMIRGILTYKAPLKGKRVATVNRAYTSQIDCTNGLRIGDRMGCRFKTESYVLDADWNAAINIRNRFLKRPFSTDVFPVDGKLLVQKGRVHSTTHKTFLSRKTL